jgi:hypothetical protein
VVTDTLSGLVGGTTYHFRLVVRRGDEVPQARDESFSTSALVQAPPTTPKAKAQPPSFSAVSSGAVSGSTVIFAVRCVAAKPSCRGSILLDASARSLSTAGRSTSRIGQSAFTRRPGGVVTVRIKLTQKALDALRKAAACGRRHDHRARLRREDDEDDAPHTQLAAQALKHARRYPAR